MSAGFRHRTAAAIVADANFEQFLSAFARGTTPAVPREFAEQRFRAGGGTAGDVLAEIFAEYPRTVSLDVILDDVRTAGAANEISGEPGRRSRELDRWDAFMDGRDPQPA
jgi:hypothetical protein